MRRCGVSKIPAIATATASAAAPRSIIDVETGERRVGRFGWKAQHATLMTFGADAYRNEMGITNDLFPHESAFGITADQMRLCDPFSDPEDIRDPAIDAGAESTISRASCASWPRPGVET